jgi:dihydrofolate synthase/folylpolyglutamate synthase
LVLDVAHNPQAAEMLDEQLGDLYVPGRRIAVCGMLDDKDVAGVATVLAGRFDAWYAVDLSDQPRGLSATALAAAISPRIGEAEVVVAGQVPQALAAVRSGSGPDDLVVVFGSFLTVGAAMRWLEQGAA